MKSALCSLLVCALSVSAFALCKKAVTVSVHERSDTNCHWNGVGGFCSDDYYIPNNADGGCKDPLESTKQCVDNSGPLARKIYAPFEVNGDCICQYTDTDNSVVDSAVPGGPCPGS